MDQEIPVWLNESFLATVLQGGEDLEPKITIIRFSVKPAVPVGNNYTSNLFRVLVEYQTDQSGAAESTSLIVKAPIEVGAFSEFTQEAGFSDKENSIYRGVLPKIFKKIGCKLGPKSFYSPIKGILILEDLVAEGYVMGDKFDQLDLSHCKKVFVALAKYHATSVALHKDDPDSIESVGEEGLYRQGGPFENIKCILKASMELIADILNEIGSHQIIAELLMSKVDTIWDSVSGISKPRADRLNVLNHGDCWTNNMLFKEDESGEVVDMQLIDFQIARYASPVLDLIYFFWTSANNDVRENHHQELCEVYLQTLNETFEKIGCNERITSEDLLEDFKLATDFVITSICIYPLLSCEPENTLDFGKITSEEFKTIKTNEKFLKVFEGKHFREKIPFIMKNWESWLSAFN